MESTKLVLSGYRQDHQAPPPASRHSCTGNRFQKASSCVMDRPHNYKDTIFTTFSLDFCPCSSLSISQFSYIGDLSESIFSLQGENKTNKQKKMSTWVIAIKNGVLYFLRKNLVSPLAVNTTWSTGLEHSTGRLF